MPNFTAKTMTLQKHAVDLWLAFPAQVDSARLQEQCHAILSTAECETLSRFHFARDRQLYLLAHALVRRVLSGYADIRPEQWVFTRNAYGRPEITPALPAPPLRFNLSHTHGLVACAVALGADIGVDAEHAGHGLGRLRENELLDLSTRFFSPQETAALKRLPASEHEKRFSVYWTLKESYIKARGLGLSLPLDRFTFHVESGAPLRISFAAETPDAADLWRFWLLEPTPEHAAAVALKVDSPSVVACLSVRTFPWTNGETEQLCPPCRCSPGAVLIPNGTDHE